MVEGAEIELDVRIGIKVQPGRCTVDWGVEL